jgi:hypothetical protein
MLRTRLVPVLVLAALLVGSAAARGQTLERPRARQGYFVGFGLHGLGARLEDDGDASRTWGMANNLRLGQMVTARLGLALAIDYGGGERGDDASTLGGLGFEGQWEVTTNLALRAGVGIGVVSIDDTSRDDDDLRGGYGAAYTLGVGYDWFLTDRRTGGWALAPVAQLRWMPGDGFSSWSGLVGLEVSWWTGLPKNRLDLAAEDAFR